MEKLVDLHVYRIPNDYWLPERRLAKNQAIEVSISAGFVRVLPELTLQDVRKEIAYQLGYDTLPTEFVFLRSIGRNFAKVRAKQEKQLKAKIFLPPFALEPELHLLEDPDSFLPYSSQSELEVNATVDKLSGRRRTRRFHHYHHTLQRRASSARSFERISGYDSPINSRFPPLPSSTPAPAYSVSSANNAEELGESTVGNQNQKFPKVVNSTGRIRDDNEAGDTDVTNSSRDSGLTESSIDGPKIILPRLPTFDEFNQARFETPNRSRLPRYKPRDEMVFQATSRYGRDSANKPKVAINEKDKLEKWTKTEVSDSSTKCGEDSVHKDAEREKVEGYSRDEFQEITSMKDKCLIGDAKDQNIIHQTAPEVAFTTMPAKQLKNVQEDSEDKEVPRTPISKGSESHGSMGQSSVDAEQQRMALGNKTSILGDGDLNAESVSNQVEPSSVKHAPKTGAKSEMSSKKSSIPRSIVRARGRKEVGQPQNKGGNRARQSGHCVGSKEEIATGQEGNKLLISDGQLNSRDVGHGQQGADKEVANGASDVQEQGSDQRGQPQNIPKSQRQNGHKELQKCRRVVRNPRNGSRKTSAAYEFEENENQRVAHQPKMESPNGVMISITDPAQHNGGDAWFYDLKNSAESNGHHGGDQKYETLPENEDRENEKNSGLEKFGDMEGVDSKPGDGQESNATEGGSTQEIAKSNHADGNDEMENIPGIKINNRENNGFADSKALQVKADSNAQQVKADSNAQQVKADSTAQQVKADSTAQQVKADSSAQKVETDSNAQQVKADSNAQQVKADSTAQQVKADSTAQQVKADSTAQQVKADSTAQQVKADSTAQQVKADSTAQQVKADSTAQQVKADSTAQQVKADSTAQQVKADSTAQQVKADSTAQQVKADSTAQQVKADSTAQQVKADSNAQQVKADSTAQEGKAESNAPQGKADTSVAQQVITDSKTQRVIADPKAQQVNANSNAQQIKLRDDILDSESDPSNNDKKNKFLNKVNTCSKKIQELYPCEMQGEISESQMESSKTTKTSKNSTSETKTEISSAADDNIEDKLHGSTEERNDDLRNVENEMGDETPTVPSSTPALQPPGDQKVPKRDKRDLKDGHKSEHQAHPKTGTSVSKNESPDLPGNGEQEAMQGRDKKTRKARNQIIQENKNRDNKGIERGGKRTEGRGKKTIDGHGDEKIEDRENQKSENNGTKTIEISKQKKTEDRKFKSKEKGGQKTNNGGRLTKKDHGGKLIENLGDKLVEDHERKLVEDHGGKLEEDHGGKLEEDHGGKLEEDHGGKLEEDHGGKLEEDHGGKLEEDHGGKLEEDHGGKLEEDFDGKSKDDHGGTLVKNHEEKMAEDRRKFMDDHGGKLMEDLGGKMAEGHGEKLDDSVGKSVKDRGGKLVEDHGGKLVEDHGGKLVEDHGGKLMKKHAGKLDDHEGLAEDRGENLVADRGVKLVEDLPGNVVDDHGKNLVENNEGRRTVDCGCQGVSTLTEDRESQTTNDHDRQSNQDGLALINERRSNRSRFHKSKITDREAMKGEGLVKAIAESDSMDSFDKSNLKSENIIERRLNDDVIRKATTTVNRPMHKHERIADKEPIRRDKTFQNERSRKAKFQSFQERSRPSRTDAQPISYTKMPKYVQDRITKAAQSRRDQEQEGLSRVPKHGPPSRARQSVSNDRQEDARDRMNLGNRNDRIRSRSTFHSSGDKPNVYSQHARDRSEDTNRKPRGHKNSVIQSPQKTTKASPRKRTSDLKLEEVEESLASRPTSNSNETVTLSPEALLDSLSHASKENHGQFHLNLHPRLSPPSRSRSLDCRRFAITEDHIIDFRRSKSETFEQLNNDGSEHQILNWLSDEQRGRMDTKAQYDEPTDHLSSKQLQGDHAGKISLTDDSLTPDPVHISTPAKQGKYLHPGSKQAPLSPKRSNLINLKAPGVGTQIQVRYRVPGVDQRIMSLARGPVNDEDKQVSTNKRIKRSLMVSIDDLPSWLVSSKGVQHEDNNLNRRQLLAIHRVLRTRRRKAKRIYHYYIRYLLYLRGRRQDGNGKASVVADMWKRKYVEEARETQLLKDHCRRMAQHLELLRHQTSKQSLPATLLDPSNQTSYKMAASKLVSEIEELSRQVEIAKVKLVAESKLKDQVEQEVKILRTEVVDRKIDASVTRGQFQQHQQAQYPLQWLHHTMAINSTMDAAIDEALLLN